MVRVRIIIKKDALVATITTDETGVAKLTNLPLGKYYVKEKRDSKRLCP